VSSGGRAIGVTVSSGGAIVAAPSGTTTGTVVNRGGEELVSSGGLASATKVASGGLAYIYSGGVAVGPTISSGGKETISLGGTASGLALLAGGVLVDDGEALFSSSGSLAGTLTGSGQLVASSGGDLVLSGSDASFAGKAVIGGGTIELAAAAALGTANVEFVEPATGLAVLQIDAADAPAAGGTFANTIYDFSAAGEDIDLRSIAFVSGASATESGSTLVLHDGGKTYTFDIAGTTADAYPVLSDGHGGTLIDPVAAAPKAIDPHVLAFAHAAAAFDPSGAANTALVSSTSPTGQTPFLHATASATAGRF